MASRILVVDDDAALRDTIGDVLTDEGYDVRLANDGQDALALLDGWEADLVILDVMMPRMGAYAFRAGLRERVEPVPPILVLSAAPGLAATGADLAATSVMSKPFRLRDLLQEIHRVLGEARLSAAGDPPPAAGTDDERVPSR